MLLATGGEDMKSVIERLWENELDCSEASEAEQEMLHRLIERYDALAETLNDEQKELLVLFDDMWSEYAGLTEREMFVHAFCMGMHLAIEVISS